MTTTYAEPTSYQQTMLLALVRTGKHIYEGTVDPATVAKRRAKNKVARISRRIGPNMPIKKAIYGSALVMLKNFGIHDAIEVTAFDETTQSGGYCETCYYEETIVEITYVSETGVVKLYTYYGKFSDLINELDN